MGNSFVLFDVSMEISPRQLHLGNVGHTQKVASPWARASYPTADRLSQLVENRTTVREVRVFK